LRRFAQQFGSTNLLDVESPRYQEQGLAYLSMDDDQAFEKLLADPKLIRLPLIRAGADLSVGIDEAAWRRWVAASQETL